MMTMLCSMLLAFFLAAGVVHAETQPMGKCVLRIQRRNPGIAEHAFEASGAFSFLGPGRWREPDLGQAVVYSVSDVGDRALGKAGSIEAVEAALLAWSDVPTSTLALDVGSIVPATGMSCDGWRAEHTKD